MVLVYNCNEDVAAVTFISGLQVTNPFYKHLMENDVTEMRDILVRAQKYIQIEEVTRATSSCPRDKGLRSRSQSHNFPEEESEPQFLRCSQTI